MDSHKVSVAVRWGAVSRKGRVSDSHEAGLSLATPTGELASE